MSEGGAKQRDFKSLRLNGSRKSSVDEKQELRAVLNKERSFVMPAARSQTMTPKKPARKSLSNTLSHQRSFKKSSDFEITLSHPLSDQFDNTDEVDKGSDSEEEKSKLRKSPAHSAKVKFMEESEKRDSIMNASVLSARPLPDLPSSKSR